VDHPWTWLRQVHGPKVVLVAAPGARAGEEADASVTAATGAVLAVHTADCAPVAMVSPHGVAVAHAGWRGAAAGVLQGAVAELRGLGDGPVHAVVGPLIGPECYEFGAEDLVTVVQALGEHVAARTSAGTPALDLPAAVGAALEAAGVDDVEWVGGCTAHADGWYSHRARGDQARQAVLVWIEP
jgi:polyphenol oxidase